MGNLRSITYTEYGLKKYLNPKNDKKNPIGHFNKELWGIYVSVKCGQVLKPSTYCKNGIKINTEFSGRLPMRTSA